MARTNPNSGGGGGSGPFSNITGTPTEVAYFDLAGNGTSDALFTRDSVTKNTTIAALVSGDGPFIGLNPGGMISGWLTGGSNVRDGFQAQSNGNALMGDFTLANNKTLFTVNDGTRVITQSVTNTPGNITSSSIISDVGNTTTWNADTTGTITTKFEQNQSLFGFPISGTGMSWSDSNTGVLGFNFVGDSTGIGSFPGTTTMGTLNNSVGANAVVGTNWNTTSSQPEVFINTALGDLDSGINVNDQYIELLHRDSSIGENSKIVVQSGNTYLSYKALTASDEWQAVLGDGVFSFGNQTTTDAYLSLDAINRLYGFGDIAGTTNRISLNIDATGITADINGLRQFALTGPSFTGSGVDNLTPSSAFYSGPATSTYTVTITAADVQFIGYGTLTGGTFSVGDTITQTTGAGTGSTGTILRDDGAGNMYLENVVVVGAGFQNTETLDNGLGVTAPQTAVSTDIYDEFSWSATGQGGGTEVSTAVPSNIDGNVTLTWGSILGHVVGDTWTFDYSYTGSVGRVLSLDAGRGEMTIGDTDSFVNGTKLVVDVADSEITGQAKLFKVTDPTGLNNWLTVDSVAAQVILGPDSATRLEIDAAQSTAKFYVDNATTIYGFAGVPLFNLDGTTYQIGIGDYANTVAGGAITIDPANNKASMVRSRFLEIEGAAVTATTDLVVGNGNVFVVNGNGTIDTLDGSNWQQGAEVVLQFTGTPTITHLAGSAGSKIEFSLAGSVDLVVTSKTTVTFRWLGGVWQETSRVVQ